MKNTIKLFEIIALVAIIVVSMVACKKSESSSSATSAPVAAEVAASTSTVDPSAINDWDTFLKEYEKFFMNEYIPLVNKMKAGDMTVYAQLQPLQDKFAAWGQQMQGFALTAGEPTEAQRQKLEELNEKVNAALEE